MKQLLFAITLGLLLVSCDDHKDFPDTATKVGHVLCTDGRVMSVDDCEAQGKRPIAVVFHINQRKDVEGDDCWYWTSTEVAGQETGKAWLYSLGSGAMQETPKTQAHKARPIITLNR